MAENEKKKQAGKEQYLSPQVMSYTSKQLLELLGPAQAYDPSRGGDTGVS